VKLVTRGTHIYTFIFLLRPTGRTAGPILMLDGLFDPDFAKEVIFRVAKSRKNCMGHICPKIKKFHSIAQA
jgi:hypothetical protein